MDLTCECVVELYKNFCFECGNEVCWSPMRHPVNYCLKCVEAKKVK